MLITYLGEVRQDSTCSTYLTDCCCADDALIAAAWCLSLVNSIITHLCKQSASAQHAQHRLTAPAVVKQMYTGYHTKDVPAAYINYKYAFQVRR